MAETETLAEIASNSEDRDSESFEKPEQINAHRYTELLHSIADTHECSKHPLFDYLESAKPSNKQIAALLRNYDAHASVLRRLLLNAAAAMPEDAVTYVLENVRNEYGNGDYSRNHQAQLRDLAWSCGISQAEFMDCKIQEGVGDFVKEASSFYMPRRAEKQSFESGCNEISSNTKTSQMKNAAITAGAITATELLAIKEFQYLQKMFVHRGLQHHIWFHHVDIEVEHSDESLNLALHFAEHHGARKAVEYGLRGVLKANVRLYDGLLASAQSV